MRLSFCILLIGFGTIVAILLAIFKACYLKLKLVLTRRRSNRRETRTREIIQARRDLTVVVVSGQGGASGDILGSPTLPPAYTEATVPPGQPPEYKPPPYSEQPPSYIEAMAQKQEATNTQTSETET